VKVLFIAPGYPDEMPYFARGLAKVGAQVYGLGDQSGTALPELARSSLTGYLRVETLWDEAAVIAATRDWLKGVTIDRVECLWEPGMMVAARLREALGVPGMSVEQTRLFRDKDLMKRALADAGVRVPKHRRASTVDEMRSAAEALGYPLIVKPVAGAGSADTHRIDDAAELTRVI
jgi:biotin carboxylase